MTALNTLPTRITDGFGRPVPYGLAYFYLAGSSTLVEVYADGALSVPRTNPVIAGGPENPGMLPQIFLDPAKSYRIVYADASDFVLFEIDNVAAAAAARTPIINYAGANYVFTLADLGRQVRRTYNGDMADTLSAAAAMGNGYTVRVVNTTSTYIDTITVSGGGTIDGLASLVLQPGQGVTLTSDGAGYYSSGSFLKTGFRQQSIPAPAWVTRPVNGATFQNGVWAVNNIAQPRWSFDQTTQQAVQFRMRLPQSYDSQPLQFAVSWGNDTALIGQTVTWGMRGRILGDNDQFDQAFGAAGEVVDLLGGALRDQLTVFTPFTPAGPAGDLGGRMLLLELYRKAPVGTIASACYVDEVAIKIGLLRGNDA